MHFVINLVQTVDHTLSIMLVSLVNGPTMYLGSIRSGLDNICSVEVYNGRSALAPSTLRETLTMRAQAGDECNSNVTGVSGIRAEVGHLSVSRALVGFQHVDRDGCQCFSLCTYRLRKALW